jgi:hypothetical protein
MNKESVLKELGIYLFNRAGDIKNLDKISNSIYKVLAYKKEIPKKVYELIPDKRYHDGYKIVFGFMWYLDKLKEPPFLVYYSIIKKMAEKLRLPIIDLDVQTRIILFTLIIDFFEENPGYLD